MAGNSFGKLLSLTSFGESHGVAIGGVIDGLPAGLPIDIALIRKDMLRRRPGQSEVTTSRNEDDEFEVLSGIENDLTTGAPVAFLIRNTDQNKKEYEPMKDLFRPSHADYTFFKKYGTAPASGGGRSSARETAVRVFAGAIARQLLSKTHDVTINAFVRQIGPVIMDHDGQINHELTETSAVRCPDPAASGKMIELIKELKEKGDSTGGIIECRIENVPAGLGEPVYDKLQADLAKAMMSINAVHGFEYGSGFGGAAMFGSSHNDQFVNESGRIKTQTNFSGGIQGGISNGMEIYFKVAFKPVSTISQTQETINLKGENTSFKSRGRHDPCVVPRAVPVVEAMAALVLADHYLRNRASKLNHQS